MEDDQPDPSKDDLQDGYIGAEVKETQDVEKSTAPLKTPDHQGNKESHHPPTPDRRGKETLPPLSQSLSGSPTLVGMVSRLSGSRATIHNNWMKPNKKEEEMSIAGSRERDITINGVSVLDVLRKKSAKDKHPRQDQKTATKGRKKSSQLATPPSANIRKYLVKKSREDEDPAGKTEVLKLSEDNQKMQDNRDIPVKDNDCDILEDKPTQENGTATQVMKKTFTHITQKNTPKKISEKILKFQDMIRGDECVIGSGRCASHNTKLVRKIVVRKMSCVDKFGGIGWRNGEVTILACPKASQPGSSSTTQLTTKYSSEAGTNKKQQIYDLDVQTLQTTMK